MHAWQYHLCFTDASLWTSTYMEQISRSNAEVTDMDKFKTGIFFMVFHCYTSPKVRQTQGSVLFKQQFR